MYKADNEISFSKVSLPPGWLSSIPLISSSNALYSMINCPLPPDRSDLTGWASALSKPYIDEQLQLIDEHLLRSPTRPTDVPNENHLVALAAFTLEGSFYKMLNGWGNVPFRSVQNMNNVAPYLRLLTEALHGLPERYWYEGFGVRVLDASRVPLLKSAFDDYENHFAIGNPVNFHSVCSFGRDESLLNGFLKESPVIVLNCESVCGYSIDDISMIPRMYGKSEGEVLVEGPSYFTVCANPRKINNRVIVEVKFDGAKSQLYSYLPRPQVIKWGVSHFQCHRCKKGFSYLASESAYSTYLPSIETETFTPITLIETIRLLYSIYLSIESLLIRVARNCTACPNCSSPLKFI